MRVARALRTITVPFLTFLSFLSQHGVAVDAAVFGETGVSNPQMTWTGGAVSCSNTNVVRFEWLISQTDSSMNGASHQPMAESGLPNVVLSFNHNILSVSQSAPSQSTTTISANQLFQNVVDDGPNVVQELTFDGGVTCANFMTAIVYSMSASCPATGTTAPALPFPIKGTVGFSATPVTVGQTGGATNNNGGAAATQAPTKAPTTAPTQVANNNNNNGGGAVSTAQNQVKLSGGLAGCFSGGGNAPASTIFQFMVAESNDGGKTFSQPMAENGLPTITVTFNAPVSSTGTVFNVANSQVAGKSWTFTLQDDQPNVGVGLTFAGVPCTNGQFASSVQYTVSAQLNGAAWGVIGTGAKGFVAGNAAIAPPAPMPTSAPTPPTTAINKNTFGTNMVTNAVQTFTQSGNCWTSNGAVHAELLFNIAQTDSASPKTPHAPMAESGLPDVTITFSAPVTVSGTFNVANSASAGNSWTFTEQDDQGVIGGGFTFGAGIQCVNGQLQPFSFNIAAKANGVFLPTTSNSPGFKALGAENLLDDGSAAGGATLVDNTNGGGSSIPIPIIAGAVAGVVVLTIAALLVIRHRRNKQAASPSAPPKVAWYVGNDTADNKV